MYGFVDVQPTALKKWTTFDWNDVLNTAPISNKPPANERVTARQDFLLMSLTQSHEQLFLLRR